jgi:ATP-dependent DNA helicase PIF1
LPPVGDKDEPDTQRFCFESDEWNTIFQPECQIQLVKIFRQTDEIYSAILNQIREGKIKRKSNDLLLQYVERPLASNLVAEPTKLFPTKNKVEQINIIRMSSLQGEAKEFKIKYLKDLEMTKSDRAKRIEFNEKDIQIELDFLAGNLMCEKEMTLKIGSQVMCIINIKSEQGDVLICNGSQGIIKGFCEITGCPHVKFNGGIERIMTRNIWESDKIPGIGVSQVPLILAWALTIHKSQGATMDAAEIDVGSGIFECGQTYVALSRVKSLDGLYLTSFDAKKIRINKKVKEFYDSLTLYHETINSFKIDTTDTTDTTSVNNTELTEEKYNDKEDNPNKNLKVIKFNK